MRFHELESLGRPARAWAGFLRGGLLGFVLVFTLSKGVAAQDPALTVIMDGSGSMWGRLGSERPAKFQIVRQGLVEALPKVPAHMRLGLVAYGRRAGCQDVEVLRAPQAGSPEALGELLADFNPKGRGPITAALQTALDTLPKGAPGTLLLVHDDPDNCQQDPCSLVGKLRAQHPQVTIHVLSLGMSPADARPMQCLTVPTNGQHYVARSGVQVANAIAEVLERAARGASATALVPKKVPPAVVPPLAGPGLQLVAQLTDVPILDVPVRWRIEPLGSDAKANAISQVGGVLTLPLQAGRYAVTAELDMLRARQEIALEKGASQRVEVSLPGGTLKVAVLAGRLNKPLDDARVIIRARDGATASPAGAFSRAAQQWIARGGHSEVGLPAGHYDVVVHLGHLRTVHEAEVVAGARRALEVRLPVGELDLAVLPLEGREALNDVIYLIQEDDPDAPQGRREVARSAAAQPAFLLPAGTYHVIARHGSLEVRDRVAIGAGERVRREIVLNAAELTLRSGLSSAASAGRPGAGSMQASGPVEDVQWRIVPLEEADGSPVRLYGPDAKVVLAAGKYRVEGRFGTLNAQASREIALSAGAREQVALTPPAARVRLQLAGEPGEVNSDIFWKVRLSNGPLVWSSTESEPVGLLQQGSYIVEVQTRQVRHELTADIRAGADRVLILGQN